jgi:nucleotide-binding universal stress UspA family protein
MQFASPTSMNTPLRLVVGYDLSALGEHALLEAIAIANAAPRAEIHVVRATEPPMSQAEFSIGSAALEATLAGAEAELEASLERFPTGPGVELRQTVRIGMPAEVLCEYARSIEAQYLLVGTHSRAGLTRALLGSVAEDTVRHAPCTVIVVRESEADLVPQVEPTCAHCIDVRKETEGRVMFCTQHPHRGRALHLHYAYPQPFAMGSMLIRDESFG